MVEGGLGTQQQQPPTASQPSRYVSRICLPRTAHGAAVEGRAEQPALHGRSWPWCSGTHSAVQGLPATMVRDHHGNKAYASLAETCVNEPGPASLTLTHPRPEHRARNVAIGSMVAAAAGSTGLVVLSGEETARTHGWWCAVAHQGGNGGCDLPRGACSGPPTPRHGMGISQIASCWRQPRKKCVLQASTRTIKPAPPATPAHTPTRSRAHGQASRAHTTRTCTCLPVPTLVLVGRPWRAAVRTCRLPQTWLGCGACAPPYTAAVATHPARTVNARVLRGRLTTTASASQGSRRYTGQAAIERKGSARESCAPPSGARNPRPAPSHDPRRPALPQKKGKGKEVIDQETNRHCCCPRTRPQPWDTFRSDTSAGTRTGPGGAPAISRAEMPRAAKRAGKSQQW